MQATRTKLAVGKLSEALLCSVQAARTFSGNRPADLEACDLMENLLRATAGSDAAELRAIAGKLEGGEEENHICDPARGDGSAA